MKQSIIILSIFAVVACAYAKPPEEMRKKFEECREEVGITERRHGPPDFDDEKEKCFTACLMKKDGKLEDGKLVLEKVIEFHKERNPRFDDEMESKLTDCIETANSEEGECEVAGSAMKCFFEKIGPPPHHHKHQES